MCTFFREISHANFENFSFVFHHLPPTGSASSILIIFAYFSLNFVYLWEWKFRNFNPLDFILKRFCLECLQVFLSWTFFCNFSPQVATFTWSITDCDYTNASPFRAPHKSIDRQIFIFIIRTWKVRLLCVSQNFNFQYVLNSHRVSS